MRTLVMGVLNVTPDSFSDGGRWLNPADAIAHGRQLIAEGADIIDVGGESTRPGSERPATIDEIGRVLPTVRLLAKDGVPISVDTMRADVARMSVDEGAAIINDVSGGLADPDMLPTVAELGVDYVLQHWRAHGSQMNDLATYDDVVTEVIAELQARIEAAVAAGIDPERIIIDPGIGFAKDHHHNWAILANLDRFNALGFRVLIGTSRKRFLGAILDGRPPAERDDATAATTFLCAQAGIWGVRTHAVRRNRDVIAVAEALKGAVR